MTETVWLTGGSSGIGADLCRQLIKDGFKVVSFARRAPPFKHNNLKPVLADLSDIEACKTIFKQTANENPSTRVVHNAGATFEKPVDEVTAGDLDAATKLHLGSAIAMVQALLPTMKKNRQGRIVLMSTRAIVGLEKRTVYSATKAGMVGMGRTWALELAPHGITVNMVAPGPIAETEMFDAVVPPDTELAERVAGRVPVGRLGRPADISRAVKFFLADDADFVTGQTLFVCGGASVGNMSFT